MKKFIFTIIALFGILMPNTALAQEGAYNEAYGVLVQTYSEDGSTLVDSYLTMYYDNKKKEHAEGIALGLDEMLQDPNMMQARRTLHSVIFDQSFAACDTIKSTKGWFAYCMELKTISGLEYLNTSEVTDMDIMFMECSSLESLDLSHFNTSKVTTMSNMFFFCENLKTLDLSSFNTENVTDMSSMFGNCMGLTTIYVGSYWSTASVTESDGMFSGCSSLVGGAGTTFSEDYTDKAYAHIDRADQPGYLTYGQSGGKGETEPYAVLSEDKSTLTFYYDDQKTARNGMDVGPFSGSPKYQSWYEQHDKIKNVIFDTSFANYTQLTSTAYWFYNCSEITTIKGIENLKTDNVVTMERMFSLCKGLTDLDVSGFDTENVTNMSSMFAYCSNIKALNLERFNTNRVTNMSDMFNGCSSLSVLDVSGFNTENVTNMGGMFENCSGITSLNVSSFNTKNVTYMKWMFYKCSGLTSLNVSGFNTNMVSNMYGLFSDCSALTNLDVSSFNTGNVENMSFMFDGCSSLKSLDVSGFNTEKAKLMSFMFSNCKEISNLDVKTFKTDNVTDMIGMFSNCTSLSNLDISSFNTSNVREIYSMFSGCSSLKAIYVGNNFNTLAVTSGSNMFLNCASIVGGAGTKYDVDHTDYTYAHIDGGESNPGYFTDVADKGKEKKEQVATPTWEFQGDLLALSTKTADASIYYATANWADEAETDSIANTIDVSTRSTLYQAPLEITDNIIIKMIAAKEGMEDSEVATFVYDYKSWKELYDVIRYGVDVLEKAKDNANVEEGLLEELRWALNEGDMMYQRRAEMSNSEAKYFTDAIVNLCKKIEDQMNAASGELEAYACQNGEDGSMLTFFYNDARNVNGGYLVDRFLADSLVTWREIKDQIRYVTFDSSFANFRPNSTAHWFEEFSNLENVTGLENLNCSEVNDMEAMFAGCKKLTTLAGIETLNTSNVVNMYRMFTECSSLEILDVSHFDTSSSIITCNMFSYCSSLENLDVSGFNTSKVVDFSHMFAGCTNLKSIDVSHFNTSSGVHMGSIFAQCSSLTSIDLSNFNTAKAEGMSMLFQDCIGLTDIDVSHLNTSNVIAIDRMFEGCTGLTTLDLSNFDTGKVTDIFQMFKDCPNLKTIYVSSKWTTDSIKVGYQVFSNCQSIVGGAGTQFDPEHTDYDYAHVDGGSANPGYFTDKNAPLVTAKYENHILTVEGDVSMAQALEQVGGRNVVAKDIAAIVWNSSEAITRSDIEGFGNPNMLIYVQTDSLAPEGVNNVVIDGKAKSIILVDAASTTNNNFYAPMAFTAESIQYTREFKQTTEKDVSRGWEGICLPFTVQKFTHESHGEIAPFGNDASIFHFWLHQMTDKGMTNATTIEANKPYIISMPNNVSYPEAYNQAGKVTFSAENATVPVSDNTAIWSADGTIGMMSTYLRIEPSEHFYALNVGNAMEGYAEGSVFVQNLRDVKPFEVYTFHEPSRNEGAGARFISVASLFGGDGTTGIIDMMQQEENTDTRWYDLNGRLLQSKPTRKGVYIQNGKKVVIK